MPASARVLLVGTLEPSRGVFAALTEAAFDVHVEAAPLRACTLLRETAFDAVVARLGEPGTDALALLRAARRHSPPAVALFHFADASGGDAVLETVRRAPDTAIVVSDEPAVAVEAVRSLLRGGAPALTLPAGLENDGRVRALLASIEAADAAASPADLDAVRARVAASARDATDGRAAWVVAWDQAGERVQKAGDGAVPPGLAAEVRLARRPLVRQGRGDDTSFLGVPVAVDDAVTAALLVEFDSGADASGGLPLAEALARLVQLSEANVRLHQRVARTPEALTAMLWAALALRGLDVEGHARRVADLAAALATSARLAPSVEGLLEIRRAALLLDVGKLGLPDAVLRHRSPFTDEEQAAARHHPLLAERMLGEWAELEGVARLVRSSRERWDGTGFPDGLARDAIPVGSRLLAVADAWDSLRFDGANEHRGSAAAALEELRRQAGLRFDPAMVSALETLAWERASSRAVDPSSEGLAVA